METVVENKPLIRRIEDALDSSFFRRFMSVAYGLGASVVIIGALFKITHIKGANEALFAGMVTEAIIFALSALQKPHVEPDWSKVHPEFTEDYHGIKADPALLKKKPVGGGQMNQLDQMLQKADVNQELIDRLGTGLKKLGDNTAKLNEVTNATVATQEFVTNMKTATQSVATLSKSYNDTSDAMNKELVVSTEFSNRVKEASQAATGLKQVYSEASKSLKDDIDASEKLSESIKSASLSAGKLTESYFKSSESIAKNIEELQKSTIKNTTFNDQLTKLSQNLSSLNSLYELQLKNSEMQSEASKKLQVTLDRYLANIEESSNRTVQYQKEMDTLTKRMSSLNNVYGNMLSAMNIK
jgi:gliding motility-associated protein GldL